MNVIAVAQLDRLLTKTARMDSQESLQLLYGHISLLKQCHNVDQWVFMADVKAIEQIPPQIQSFLEIKLVTGLQSDPLDEFYQAATQVEETNELPFFNPTVLRVVLSTQTPDTTIIDSMIQAHRDNGFDYCRNPQVDDGFSPFIELMSFSALHEAWREALLPDDRENITPYIYRQHQRLNVGVYQSNSNHGNASTTLIA